MRVVTFGELMVRLQPFNYERFVQANNLYMNWGEFAYFDIYILQREGAREDWAEFSKGGHEGG